MSLLPVSSDHARNTMADEVLSIKEVAALLNLAEKTVYSMAHAGEILTVKVCTEWRIKRPELDRWIGEQPCGGHEALPVPSVGEQCATVEHIARETANRDTARAATERTIALLKQRRSALIAAVVTGHLGVEEAG